MRNINTLMLITLTSLYAININCINCTVLPKYLYLLLHVAVNLWGSGIGVSALVWGPFRACFWGTLLLVGLTLFCENYYFTKKITTLQRKNSGVEVHITTLQRKDSGVEVHITNLRRKIGVEVHITNLRRKIGVEVHITNLRRKILVEVHITNLRRKKVGSKSTLLICEKKVGSKSTLLIFYKKKNGVKVHIANLRRKLLFCEENGHFLKISEITFYLNFTTAMGGRGGGGGRKSSHELALIKFKDKHRTITYVIHTYLPPEIRMVTFRARLHGYVLKSFCFQIDPLWIAYSNVCVFMIVFIVSVRTGKYISYA